MMKRAKGATLAKMMAATKWQAHTVRGFVSILGSNGGEKIDSSNELPRRLRTRLFVGLWRESADRYSTAVNRSTSRVSRYSKSSIRTNF